MSGAWNLAGPLPSSGNHRGTRTRGVTGTRCLGPPACRPAECPSKSKSPANPKSSLSCCAPGAGQPSSPRAALEMAIANSAPLTKQEIGQGNDQGRAAARPAPIQGPPVKLPPKPPDRWQFNDLRKVLLTVAFYAPSDIGASKALAAMGISRLSELPASRFAEYLGLIGERHAPQCMAPPTLAPPTPMSVPAAATPTRCPAFARGSRPSAPTDQSQATERYKFDNTPVQAIAPEGPQFVTNATAPGKVPPLYPRATSRAASSPRTGGTSVTCRC